MICKHCGNEIDEKLPFCPYCGNKTEEQAPTPAPGAEQTPAAPAVQPSDTPEAPQGAQPEQVPYAVPVTPPQGQPGQFGQPGQTPPQGQPGQTPPQGQPGQFGQPPQGQQYYIPPQPGQQVYVYTDRFGGFPMKWHKFLVYFGIWAMSVINFIEAIRTLTGTVYGAYTSEIYNNFPLLLPSNIVYGILTLALAALGIVTAVMMLGLKKNAPKLLHALFIGSTALELIYSGVLMLLTSGGGGTIRLALFSVSASEAESALSYVSTISQMVITLGISALIIALNVMYYNKRKQFFVN